VQSAFQRKDQGIDNVTDGRSSGKPMSPAKVLIYLGLALAALGTLLSLAPGALSWFGKLPGDINIEGEHGRVFIPITSMIVVSLVLTLLVNLFGRR
jgi:hypothetical protein